ncbi:MAG: TetR/AcrR family transcriptional regulator [Syntrophales bacterium]|nr:TetR/AcrR family transcriptional regulator [Syntrophales bacterium]
MNRREASKKETRQLILTAARQLFAQKGMEECTIRDIAKKAGVSPASVVVHFQSKTALLEEALNRDIEKAMSVLIDSLPPDQGLLERLLHLANGFFRLYNGNRNLYRALIRHTIFEPVKETPHMTGLTDRYIHFLTGMIEEEKVRGLLRPEVDAMVAAGAIFSLYLGALIMLFRQPEMPVDLVTEVLAAMTGQYLQGISLDKE